MTWRWRSIRPTRAGACPTRRRATPALAWAQTHQPARLVLEATGGHERAVDAALVAAGLPVVVINPRQEARLRPQATSRSRRTAWTRSCWRCGGGPPAAALGGQVTTCLVRRRRQLLTDRVAEQQRRPLAQPGHRRPPGLAERLADFDAEIAAALQADPALGARATWLQSIPGIGPTASATLLAELELGRLSAGRLRRLVGVAPFNRDTAPGAASAASRAGAPPSGPCCTATVAATRANPVIRAFYLRLRAAGAKVG